MSLIVQLFKTCSLKIRPLSLMVKGKGRILKSRKMFKNKYFHFWKMVTCDTRSIFQGVLKNINLGLCSLINKNVNYFWLFWNTDPHVWLSSTLPYAWKRLAKYVHNYKVKKWRFFSVLMFLCFYLNIFRNLEKKHTPPPSR